MVERWPAGHTAPPAAILPAVLPLAPLGTRAPMTTRAIIAIPDEITGGWSGSYHHLDGGPPLAEHLAALVAEHGPAEVAKRYAYAGHPWWNIVGTDHTQPARTHRTGRWLSSSTRPPETMRGYPRRLHTAEDHWPVAWLQLIHPDGTIESRRNP